MMTRLSKALLTSIMVSVLAAGTVGCGSDSSSTGKTGNGVYSTSKSVDQVLEEQTGNAKDDSEEVSEDTDKSDSESVDAADNNENTKEGIDAVNEQLNEAKEQAKATAGGDVDVDLTKLTSTMVYSEVYNMVTEPSEYMGKTVRMKGITSVYHDDVDNNDYYACVIQDATACCAQGIEFVLNDGNYPEANTEVTVVGTFSSYKIEDYEYFTLKDAVME